jgi:hypothetical protein
VSRKTEKEQKRPEWKPRSDYAVTEDFRDDGQGLSTLMRCAPDGDVHGE